VSEIEWTDVTWNPVAGCSVHSAGCTNCYAMNMAHRLNAMGLAKYKNVTEKVNGRPIWTGAVNEDWAVLERPKKWKKPRKIFVNSMSDLFHENVSDHFIQIVWRVMADTPQHKYQILTKRPESAHRLFHEGVISELPNVWFGVSVENRASVHRINYLKDVPAAVRFISFEPLIGPVGDIAMTDIHWAIVGGESGRGARPMKEVWIDEIFEQCRDQGVSFFFKQWGTWGSDNKKRSKKRNGRTYKGRHWDAMPLANA